MKPKDKIKEEVLKFKCKYCCSAGCDDGNYHDENLAKEALKNFVKDVEKIMFNASLDACGEYNHLIYHCAWKQFKKERGIE